MRGRALVAAAVLSLAAAPAFADDFHPVDPDNLLVVDTSKGRVIVELRPDIAPNHVARVKALVRKGYFDDDVFYRVQPNFVVQTGTKTVGGDNTSGMGTLKAEFSFHPAAPIKPVVLGAGFSGGMPVAVDADGTAWPKFCPGTASTAHYDDPNSADSQIFFLTGPALSLDRTFTAWGRVVAGQDVLRQMAPGEPPPAPDHLIKAHIASELPEAERPKVLVADPGTPTFQAAIEKAEQTNGGYLDNICLVVPPVEVK
ncbi:MAG TPA: peptidylprolyl isomerase [Caulobacteraceae bacterium]|jgi:peptidylprolyl isomerase|nr:peptidylprolyl isomerase [Caulobacteraceae bacterium]